MNEDVRKVGIEYNADINKFIIILNGGSFHFTPNQYMEFINHSIVAVNSIIAEKFSNSLKSFMEDAKVSKVESTKLGKKKAFTKKDCGLIADDVEKWFKEHSLDG